MKRWQDDEYLTREFGDLMMDVEYGKKENRSDPSDAMTLAQYDARAHTALADRPLRLIGSCSATSCRRPRCILYMCFRIE